MIKSIKEAGIIEGMRVIVRADWNVPTDDAGKILDTSRIEVTLPTLKYILENKGIAVVISHFGREGESMKSVFSSARELLIKEGFEEDKIIFIEDPFSHEGREKINALQVGGIAVLENIRKWPEEEKNDESFSKSLSSLGDIYVNEAFSNSHRKHASMVGIPQFLPHFAGLRLMEEYQKLSEAFTPEHPFLLILGGAKFETKMPLVEKFLNIADYVFIGGANAATASSMPLASNPKVILPVGDIKALDANHETLELLRFKIQDSKFILWNGPLGNYENGYTEGTTELAKMLAESGAKVITGGGDTENAIDDLNISDKFYFISLAGGAMLEFLANGNLPALEALDLTPHSV